MFKAKNIRTKPPSKKLSPKLYCPFNGLEKNGRRASKLEIFPRWKIHSVFHVSLFESYPAWNRRNHEQPPRDPEYMEGDLGWEVERIAKSVIISYT